MAWSFACHTFSQNLLLNNKDKFTGVAPTKGNNTPAISHANIPTFAVILLVISASFFLARYLKNDF